MSAKRRSKAKKSTTRDFPSGKKDPPTAQTIRSIDVEEFVRRLRAETSAEKRFALFLGAGCSVTSGIPAAGTLVKDRWIPRLRDYRAPHRKDLDAWAKEVIEGYDSESPARSYGSLIDKLFLTPEDRQREIADLCEGRTPAFGYAVLAQLVALSAGGFNVVLTTNFDDLLADALYLYTDARPLIIHHESLAAYIRPTRTRPLLIKLHGDHRLSPRNTVLETQTLAEEFQRHAAMVLHDRGIIFMGYGGADLGILKMLNSLPSEALPFGAYWVHPEEPHGQVREWLAHRQGVWVRSGWFDEVMLLVRNAFDLPHPSPERFTRIFDEYQQKFKALSTAIQERPSNEAGVQALKEAVVSAEAVLPGFWKPMVEAYRMENQDPDRADEIYRQGVAQFPKAVLLRVAYANFLWYIRRSYDVAEAIYRQALDTDPKNADLLANYGLFLEVVRKDYETADATYKRALDYDPKNSNTLRSYALFLSDVRKNQDAAEVLFKRALEFAPQNANALTGYAFFLGTVRKDYDAAEAMYKRSLEADPKHPGTLGNYANFLKNIRKDYDAAEAMYKRALDAGPKQANNINNYASLINNIRKDYDAAERMYRRALEADPNNPNISANLAQSLLAQGKADGMTILYQTIELLRDASFPDAEIECAFYLFAHGTASEQLDALRTARRLLGAGVRSPNWDFSRNIERARLNGHPEVKWLGKLASVINDEAKPEVLNGWSAWESAAA